MSIQKYDPIQEVQLRQILNMVEPGDKRAIHIHIESHNSHNTTTNDLRYEQARLEPRADLKPSQVVGPLFFAFWALCMAILLGIAVGEN